MSEIAVEADSTSRPGEEYYMKEQTVAEEVDQQTQRLEAIFKIGNRNVPRGIPLELNSYLQLLALNRWSSNITIGLTDDGEIDPDLWYNIASVRDPGWWMVIHYRVRDGILKAVLFFHPSAKDEIDVTDRLVEIILMTSEELSYV